MPDDCPEAVARIFMQCQASNPAERPTAKEVAVRLQKIVAEMSQSPVSLPSVDMCNPGSNTSSSAWAYDMYPNGN